MWFFPSVHFPKGLKQNVSFRMTPTYRWDPYGNFVVWKRWGKKTYQQHELKLSFLICEKMGLVTMWNSTLKKVSTLKWYSKYHYNIRKKTLSYKKCYSTLSRIFYIARKYEDEQKPVMVFALPLQKISIHGNLNTTSPKLSS